MAGSGPCFNNCCDLILVRRVGRQQRGLARQDVAPEPARVRGRGRVRPPRRRERPGPARDLGEQLVRRPDGAAAPDEGLERPAGLAEEARAPRDQGHRADEGAFRVVSITTGPPRHDVADLGAERVII